jgi:hypothetical protein
MIIKGVVVPNHSIFFLIVLEFVQKVEYLHDYSKIEKGMQNSVQLEITVLYPFEEY